MNSNLTNLSNSPSPKSAAIATTAVSPIVNPYASPNQARSNDSWTNNWHSANPLVMNHQLASPQAISSNSNNNASSLDNLDPFGGSNKSVNVSIQRPAVNYIYPSGYNGGGGGVGVSNGNALNSMNNFTPLLPQQNTTQQQSQDNKNLNTLSQQDILSFLN